MRLTCIIQSIKAKLGSSTHTAAKNHNIAPEMLLLRDRIIRYLNGATQIEESKVLDLIKFIEGIKDSRQSRLELLITGQLCERVYSNPNHRRATKLIKFSLSLIQQQPTSCPLKFKS